MNGGDPGDGDARASCALCTSPDAQFTRLVAESPRLRVARVLDAPDFPAYYRVIWRAHVAEFTDLSPPDRAHCMAAVAIVEEQLRALQPAKINLAALGNMVPHLHWHVIARFAWDSHFPQAIWGPRQRDAERSALRAVIDRLDALDGALRQAITSL